MSATVSAARGGAAPADLDRAAGAGDRAIARGTWSNRSALPTVTSVSLIVARAPCAGQRDEAGGLGDLEAALAGAGDDGLGQRVLAAGLDGRGGPQRRGPGQRARRW